MKHQKEDRISCFWFRRDLRLKDNAGLFFALQSGFPVLPVFIFDINILKELKDKKDRRVEFIYSKLQNLNIKLNKIGSSLLIKHGDPLEVWINLSKTYTIANVFTNDDYEPYAHERDEQINNFLKTSGIEFHTFKDQVIFEKDEILKQDQSPYTVFTPYRKQWQKKLQKKSLMSFPSEKLLENFYKYPKQVLPTLQQLGFEPSGSLFPSEKIPDQIIEKYHHQRDYPAIEGTSKLSIHLRFGTISIRGLVLKALELNETWLSELIWREFFMMILFHYPHVVDKPFKKKYESLPWRNDENEFKRWCHGQTGYPLVDAGMRELNNSGFMHNRLRMITASFLTKHLLIDWRWGERYFAQKLADFELSSNNGNWQWAAGCGCDAAPYFRIFNPIIQAKKFDPKSLYIKKWIPEFDTPAYPPPIVDHPFARQRCLDVFRSIV
jgi:deoxyribodipyrimidine photo-lyase